MTLGPMLALSFALVLALAALAVSVAAFVAARQSRVQNLPDVVGLRGVALEARQEVVALRGEWKATLGALDAAMEALDDKADTIGRRRKRADMAEQRRAKGEEQAEQGDPLELALRNARSQGLPV